MPLHHALLTTSLALLAVAASAQTPAPPAERPQPPAAEHATPDAEFLARATESGLMEVELGKLASRKATHPEVKAFAALMMDDHGKSTAELTSLKTSTPRPPAKSVAAPATLTSAEGADFDRAYMAEMVAMHEKSVALYEKQSRDGKDGVLKKFAADTLPTVRTHLVRAKALRVKIGAATNNR